MPFEMSYYLQSIVLRGKVYVGGGITGDFKSSKNCTIMEYDIASGKWDELPIYRACDFAMAAVDEQLVLLGGEEANQKIGAVGVWSPDDCKWMHPYPDLLAARSRCSVAVSDMWLVVAGG